jgi:N-acetylmuramoyl-L-alanine amidase
MRVFILILSFLIGVSGHSAPRPRKKVSKKPVIILDAGHGGIDRGAKVRNPYIEEKKVALQTAHLVRKYLTQKGYKVLMTRDTDVFIPLAGRVRLANPKRASAFVSLHYNSSSNQKAHGIEVFFHNHKKERRRAIYSERLAKCVLQKMIGATSARSRGVKNGNFFVIREAKVPSILIEGGFLTHLGERKKLKRTDYLQTLARSIADGVDQYFKTHKYVLGAI